MLCIRNVLPVPGPAKLAISPQTRSARNVVKVDGVRVRLLEVIKWRPRTVCAISTRSVLPVPGPASLGTARRTHSARNADRGGGARTRRPEVTYWKCRKTCARSTPSAVLENSHRWLGQRLYSRCARRAPLVTSKTPYPSPRWRQINAHQVRYWDISTRILAQ